MASGEARLFGGSERYQGRHRRRRLSYARLLAAGNTSTCYWEAARGKSIGSIELAEGSGRDFAVSGGKPDPARGFRSGAGDTAVRPGDLRGTLCVALVSLRFARSAEPGGSHAAVGFGRNLALQEARSRGIVPFFWLVELAPAKTAADNLLYKRRRAQRCCALRKRKKEK